MRILILPAWYPTPAHPVTGSFVRDQAAALSAVHDVRVLYLDVLPRGDRRRPRRQVTRERGFVEEIVEVPNRPLRWQFAYLWALWRAWRRRRRTFRPDVVHCHVAVPAGWAAVLLRRLLGVPVVLTEHSSEFGSWRRRPGLRWMARRAFVGADAVIAVSEGQRARLMASFPRTRRLLVIPNMVDTQRFAPSPLPPTAGGYRLLFVGLLDTPQKGLPVLLAALAALRGQADRPLHVDVIGDGALRAGYEREAARRGLGATVTFLGILPPAAVAARLRASHALVLPSLHESQGLVVIEALASGRPAVATRCGGPEFILDATTGLLVEPGQPAALAAAIRELLTHLDRYDPAHLAALAASRYGQAAVTARLTALYRSLLPE